MMGLLALAMATYAFAQDVTLKRDLKPNSQDVYKVEMSGSTQMDIPNVGPQDLNVTGGMNYAMKYGAVEQGVAQTDFLLSDIKLQMSGGAADMMGGAPELPKEIRFKGKLDERNRITDFKPDSKLDMMGLTMASTASTMTMFIEFPDRAVKVGDSWKVKVPRNAMVGNEESELTATLVGEKDGMWDLKMSGELKIKNDMSEMMKGMDPTGTGMDMQMVVTGTMKLDTTAQVDKTTGQTKAMVVAMQSKSVLDIVNMGIKMDQSSKTTMKMTLQ